MNEMMIGIIGCGVICDRYIDDIQHIYRELHVKSCADIDSERSRQKASMFGIEAVTVDDLLADPQIGIVVNLTPPRFHEKINEQIIRAGKHLFCEKPFALSLEAAQRLCTLAAERGVAVSGAPDTILGSSLQTCRKLIDDGWIGKPLYVTANMMSHGVELWHPAPQAFYQRSSGPLFDMGPYYLTALVCLLGGIRDIYALGARGYRRRTIGSQPLCGQTFEVETDTHYSITMRLASSVVVSMNLSFDIWYSSLPMMEIYGTEGTLVVPDPNMSGGRPKVFRKDFVTDGKMDDENSVPVELPELFPCSGSYTRGAGVLELARSVKDHRSCRIGSELLCHVTEAMEGIMESSVSKTVYQMSTVCRRPSPNPASAV